MKKNLGILLKNYSPKKEKVSVLDSVLGRIEAVLHNANIRSLHNGTLFSYHAELRYTNIYTFTTVEILDIPFGLAKHDIYFFHHMLELCYYFLPLHVACPSVFDLISMAFKQELDNKPIILLRFFALLGIYPEEPPFEKNYFLRLLSCPVETIIKEKLDDTQLKVLESWLLRCLEMHPYKKQFKTHYVVSR
jgi:hypothetical protein